MNQSPLKILEMIPGYIYHVVDELNKAGFEAYLVGGCVRDILQLIKPKDFDITTNAKPEEIAKVFPRCVTTYAKFGTVLVLISDEHGEYSPVEVTTYRSEMDYYDGRWPAKVEFTTHLSKDLGRRDFTINALALKIIDKNYEIVDLFDGQNDLKKRIIRAVGTPIERFREDGLRGFRACRLASVLGLEIESETFQAIKEARDVSARVSIERIRDEFLRLIMESPKPSKGIDLLRYSGLLEIFLPELLEGIGIVQPEYHVGDVYEHLLASVDNAPDSVKLAALFHDIGKPRAKDAVPDQDYIDRQEEKGRSLPSHHFYGHDKISAEMTQEIMTRMKFSRAQIERTVNLVRYHMFYYQDDWTDTAIRRFINRVGSEEMVDLLFLLRIADAASNPKSQFDSSKINDLAERIANVRSQEMALNINDLKISGSDLIRIGMKQGKEIGLVLNYLMEKVLEDPLLNNYDTLLKLAREYWGQKNIESKK